MTSKIREILDELYRSGVACGGNGISFSRDDNPRLDEAEEKLYELSELIIGKDDPEGIGLDYYDAQVRNKLRAEMRLTRDELFGRTEK
jgi:hypothetical protein